MLIGRAVLVAIAAVLLSIQVVRSAAVDAWASIQPDLAARFWRSHPAVEISGGLVAIGRAAREHRPVPGATFSTIDDAAIKAPLSPEPFLVRGVQAQGDRHGDVAERAFTAAQWRDPRSLSAAYFLADRYFRSNEPLQGLVQAAVLARLSPKGASTLAPFVATYAQNPGNWAEIRQLFKTQEGLEDGVLLALAQSGRNAAIIFALADSEHRRPDSAWIPTLLNSLIAERNYALARSIWARIGGPRSSTAQLLYDPAFSSPTAAPPFNWALTTSAVGLAERQPGGGLHVLFYGNEDGILARQLLVLAPGNYQLKLTVQGAPAHAETLSWAIRCDQSGDPLASAGVGDIARQALAFRVPVNCPAQWLELSGRSADVSQQADVTIGRLTLVRAGSDV